LCARVVPELVQIDEHGYPEFLDAPVPFWLSRDAKQAVDMCPALALSLTRVKEEPVRSPLPGPVRMPVPDLTSRSAGMPALNKRAKRDADLAMNSAWIAALGDGRVE
jgi:ferredoxin